MNFKELLLFLLGVFFALIAFFLVLGTMIKFETEHVFQATDAILLVTGIVILGLALWISTRSIQKSKQRKGDQQENQILKLTAQYGGRITATEIAMNTKAI